jgi:hypothetical protein
MRIPAIAPLPVAALLAGRADLCQPDGNVAFRATKEAALFEIQTGDERYEVPEAAVLGGDGGCDVGRSAPAGSARDRIPTR